MKQVHHYAAGVMRIIAQHVAIESDLIKSIMFHEVLKLAVEAECMTFCCSYTEPSPGREGAVDWVCMLSALTTSDLARP